MTERRKLFMAATVASVGILAVVISATTPGLFAPKPPEVVPVPEVLLPQQALSDTAIDTYPSAENVEEVMDGIDRRLLDRVGGLRRFGFSREQRNDLRIAGVKRLRSILFPDFQRDFEAMSQRGLLLKESEARQSFEKHRQTFEWLSLAPCGLQQIELRVVKSPGGRCNEKLKDYMILTSSVRQNRAFDYSYGADAVEVLMPVSAKTVPGVSKDPRGTVLIGCQFAWSSSRMRWIPSKLSTYAELSVGKPPDNKFVCVPSSL